MSYRCPVCSSLRWGTVDVSTVGGPNEQMGLCNGFKKVTALGWYRCSFSWRRSPEADARLGIDAPQVDAVDALAALFELVRLKDLHDRIEAASFDTYAEHQAAVKEYERAKPSAWATARRLLLP